MKYYCGTISADLAEKLKEKGMSIDNVVDGMTGEKYCLYTYGHIFDWLMEKGTYIDGYPIYHITNKRYTNEWCFYVMSNNITQEKEADYESFGTWHEAANAAIEKALTLI